MNVQEMCDYAVAKIVEQEGQCLMSEFSCAYTANDKHCAIGWLIQDCYVPEMENHSLAGLLNTFELPEIFKQEAPIFEHLQYFHDARTKKARLDQCEDLVSLGIDTSKPQYQQWIEMGE